MDRFALTMGCSRPGECTLHAIVSGGGKQGRTGKKYGNGREDCWTKPSWNHNINAGRRAHGSRTTFRGYPSLTSSSSTASDARTSACAGGGMLSGDGITSFLCSSRKAVVTPPRAKAICPATLSQNSTFVGSPTTWKCFSTFLRQDNASARVEACTITCRR